MGETSSASTEFRAMISITSAIIQKLNHATLGGMKATNPRLQSTLKRHSDLFHSHSCFSIGIPLEPPCSSYAPASTNQAADESTFLDQSFGGSSDWKKNLLLEGGAPGREERKRHHPPSLPHPPCQSFGSPASKTAGLENKLFRDRIIHSIAYL